ncbi:hypothetical protein V7056_08080, partial [Bacillus sp. JJ664]
PKSTLWGWCNKNNTPSINNLAEISYRLDCNIEILFTTDLKELSGLRIRENETICMKQSNTKREVKKLNLDKISSHLQKLEKDTNATLSIREVAKNLKVSTKTLYKYFPELCNKIVIKNKNILADKCRDKIIYLKSQIELKYNDFLKVGIQPTRKKIENELNYPALFKKKELRLFFYYLKDKENGE